MILIERRFTYSVFTGPRTAPTARVWKTFRNPNTLLFTETLDTTSMNYTTSWVKQHFKN